MSQCVKEVRYGCFKMILHNQPEMAIMSNEESHVYHVLQKYRAYQNQQVRQKEDLTVDWYTQNCLSASRTEYFTMITLPAKKVATTVKQSSFLQIMSVIKHPHHPHPGCFLTSKGVYVIIALRLKIRLMSLSQSILHQFQKISTFFGKFVFRRGLL